MGSTVTFSGLASGLDTASIVDQLMALERLPVQKLSQKVNTLNQSRTEAAGIQSKISNLQKAIQTLTDAKLGGSFDIFKQKIATTSDATKVVATVSNTAVENGFSVQVNRLATATGAKSVAGVGLASTTTTVVKDVLAGSISSGNFSVFVNGARHDIAVAPTTDTMGDVLNRVVAVLPAGSVSMNAEGKIQFSFSSGTDVRFGSASDTSNFAQVSSLFTGATTSGVGTDTFTSQYGSNTVVTSGKLTNNDVKFTTAVTAGTVSIAGDSYTIDASTTLDSLMQAVNTKNKVVMSFDRNTNKLSILSKSTGAQAISFGTAADTSNFLSAAGLVVAGNSLTSQTLGQNAEFVLDGTTYQSANNSNISSSVHGLAGVTLDLKGATGTDSVSLSVASDKAAIKTAMSTMLTAINDAMLTIASKTDFQTGTLKGDQSMIRLRSGLRSKMSESVAGLTTYKDLSAIGISTGAATASPSKTGSSAFQLDEAKFFAALAANPAEVKALLVGDETHTGILQSLKTSVVDASLDPSFGLFTSREKSINDKLKTTNESITNMNARLERREKALRAQFTAMEQSISRLKQQQGSF